MVEGTEKKPVVDQILAGRVDYPAARVSPTDGHLTWILGWPTE
jgi:6-phosphogluconolactonase/glucosamine-6-phosphate isomerase/deaminase